MTSKRVVFQSALDKSTIAQEGQQPQPLLDFLRSNGLLQVTSIPQVSTQSQAKIKTPILDVWKSGHRPLRQLLASVATGLNTQTQTNTDDKDKQKSEAVKKTQEKAKDDIYSEASIFS